MKLKDAEIGMIVVDKVGNEYAICDIDNVRNIAYLMCIKFVKSVRINNILLFRMIGDGFWIADSPKDGKIGYYFTMQFVEPKLQEEEMCDKEFLKKRIDKIFDMVDNLDDEKRYEVMQELSTFKVELLKMVEKPKKTFHGGIMA